MNPHPPLAALPVVIALTLLGAEIFVPSARRYLLTILAVATLAAYISGDFGLDFALRPAAIPFAADLSLTHQAFARAALIATFPLVLLGIIVESGFSKLILLYRVALALVSTLLIIAAYHGGELVFEHGAGVDQGAVTKPNG